jgi:signal transduction histidine kinase
MTLYSPLGETARGYTLIHDILGSPTLILKLDMLRTIYQQGQTTVVYFMLVLGLVGLLLGGTTLYLLEQIVLKRLSRLNQCISEIARNGNLHERVSVEGRDELASLSITINGALAEIEEAQGRTLSLNQDLALAIDELNIVQRSKDRFFTHASHEFRTPLSVLRTRLYLARKTPEKWAIHLNELDDACDTLVNIVEDVFDIAQFNQHNVKLNRQQVEMASVLREAIRRKRERIREMGIMLNNSMQSNLLVRADFDNLAQAVEHVLTYFLNRARPDSTITVELTNNDGATVAIWDRGLTLPGSNDDLFTPFQDASTGQIRQTGLGLTIAREIIELHGGCIQAINDSERGGCIEFQLQISKSPTSVSLP